MGVGSEKWVEIKNWGEKMIKAKKTKGYTLVELLVVIAIVGILSALSLVALGGTRKTARDGKRKVDIEQIRSALEIYRADCKRYPASLPAVDTALIGDGTNCPAANVYLQKRPGDPLSTYFYVYKVGTGNNSYNLCAYLELGNQALNYDGASDCNGSCGTGIHCNHMQKNP